MGLASKLQAEVVDGHVLGLGARPFGPAEI